MKTFVGQKYLIFRVKGGSPKLFRNKLAIILFGPGGLFMSKMPMFQRAGMREGGLPLPLAFQYLILMI